MLKQHTQAHVCECLVGLSGFSLATKGNISVTHFQKESQTHSCRRKPGLMNPSLQQSDVDQGEG